MPLNNAQLTAIEANDWNAAQVATERKIMHSHVLLIPPANQ